MNRTDLADPTAGILASLESHRPLAVFERGGNGGVASFELETEPLGGRLELGGDRALGHWWVEGQRLKGRLRAGDGSTTPLEAIGAVTRSEDDDALSSGLRRNIVICLEDASLLAIFASRQNSGDEHGNEKVAGALATASGEVIEFEEVLLSTEYGPDRRQRRATLELRPVAGSENTSFGGSPIRGAGVAVAATDLALPGAKSTLAFFEWSIAGHPAIGRYEIIRAE